MAYVEVGSGSPIVFLHGNPTSSFIWRNVLPHVEHLGRCIAPDLIGMGDSEKLARSGPGSYRFLEHRAYLESLLESLDVVRDVTFVVHDWGSALGFDWARRHPSAVRGIAYMEAIMMPLTWDAWPKARREQFEQLRGRDGGRWPSSTTSLSSNCCRLECFGGSQPRNTKSIAARIANPARRDGRLSRGHASFPSTVNHATSWPSSMRTVCRQAIFQSCLSVFRRRPDGRPPRIRCRWPNQREVVVAGRHFVQEDSPDAIGEALAA